VTARRSLLIALLAIAYFAEGLDIFLVGKLAPVMATSFAAPVEAMTPVFIGHQAGLALGALVGGRIADSLGRRPVLLAALFLAGLTTLAVPLTRGLAELVMLRAFAGLFLGAAAPCVLASVTAIGSSSSRRMVLSIVLASYSLGAASGSLVALTLIDDFGWGVGFALTGALLLAAAGALCGVLADSDCDPPGSPSNPAALLRPTLLVPTVLLSIAFALSMGLIAFLSAWTPSLFAERAGVSVQRFGAVGLLAGPAAIVGMLGVGSLSSRLSWRSVCALVFVGHAASLAALGIVPFASLGFAWAYGMSIAFQAGGQALLNITVAERYPTPLRATAYGVAAAIGRTSGILAAWIGGAALVFDWSLVRIYGTCAIVPLVVGALVATLNHAQQKRL